MTEASRKLFGEVYTPKWFVKQIIDTYIPEVLLNVSYTVLEPAVGDGRFLTYILHQRLLQSKDTKHVIQSLSTLYGIDVQKDNVIRTREELRKTILHVTPEIFEIPSGDKIIRHIIEHNIIHGCAISKKYVETNMPIMIRHYEIVNTDPLRLRVDVYNLGDVLNARQQEVLFNKPTLLNRYILE